MAPHDKANDKPTQQDTGKGVPVPKAGPAATAGSSAVAMPSGQQQQHYGLHQLNKLHHQFSGGSFRAPSQTQYPQGRPIYPLLSSLADPAKAITYDEETRTYVEVAALKKRREERKMREKEKEKEKENEGEKGDEGDEGKGGK